MDEMSDDEVLVRLRSIDDHLAAIRTYVAAIMWIVVGLIAASFFVWLMNSGSY